MKRHREIIVVAGDSIESLFVLAGTPDVFEGFEQVHCLELVETTDKHEFRWIMEGTSV